MKRTWNETTGPWLAALLVVAGVAVLGAMVMEPRQARAQESGAAEGVLAVVGGREITQAEVESAAAGELLQVRQQEYQILETALSRRIDQTVLELEAEARDTTPQELVAAEVDAKLEAVTDEDVAAFYEQNKARINQPMEEMSARIQEYLASQRRSSAMANLYAALREKYEVASFLEPVRIDVATEGHPAMGPADAPVTIVEFSDFQCPYCSRVVPTLKQVVDEYDGKVRLVFRQFPLRSIHPQAQKAAEASLCAAEQDKFWEMHDAMFADQRQLEVENLKAMAETVGMDVESFNECLDSGRHAEAVQADLDAGQAVGVSGTPAMFINGRFASGALPFDQLSAIVEQELERDSG